jgi:hypothetical protein
MVPGQDDPRRVLVNPHAFQVALCEWEERREDFHWPATECTVARNNYRSCQQDAVQFEWEWLRLSTGKDPDLFDCLILLMIRLRRGWVDFRPDPEDAKHFDVIVNSCLRKLQDRSGCTRLFNVKSHSGLLINDRADMLADHLDCGRDPEDLTSFVERCDRVSERS